jgi:NitT/TauT family transport system permease protein
LYPYAVVLQVVPVVAVAPIIVLWFSFSTTSIVVVAFMIAVFPMLNNTLLGLRSTDRNQLDLFRLHKAGAWKTYIKLRMPSAMPHIIAGARISAGLAVIGAIVGEFFIGQGGSQGGLGVQITYAQAQLQTSLLFAEVAVATFLGVLFFLVVTAVGHLYLRNWHESVVAVEDR